MTDAVHAPVTEPVVEAKPAEDPKLAEGFSRLNKQETYVREERKKMEEARKAFESDKREVEEFKNLKKLKESDPLKFLASMGLSYEQISQRVAEQNRPVDPVAKKAWDEVEKLKNEIANKDEQAKQERLTKAETHLRSEITNAAKDFDVIGILGAENEVRAYMEEMYSATGEIPDVRESCKAVADHIISLHVKISNSPLLKPQETKAQAPQAVEVAQKPTEKPKVTLEEATKTLTNKMTQSSTSQVKPMNDQERIKAAIAAYAALAPR